jgi:hypothetical protein
MSWPAGTLSRRCCWPTAATGRLASSAAGWMTARSRIQIPYVVEVRGDTSASPEQVHPVAAPYAGKGRWPRPRYHDKPSSLAELALAAQLISLHGGARPPTTDENVLVIRPTSPLLGAASPLISLTWEPRAPRTVATSTRLRFPWSRLLRMATIR